MKNITTRTLLLLALMVGGLLRPADAQIVLTTVTNSSALNNMVTTFNVSSTSGITAPTATGPAAWLFVPRSGELMSVSSVPTSGTVTVVRGAESTRAEAIAVTTTMIVVTSPLALIRYDPKGACVRGTTTGTSPAGYSPVINTTNGRVWVCRSSLWQGGDQTLITFNSVPPFTP